VKNFLYSLSTVILSTSVCMYADLTVAPYLQWRSQGRDTARKLVGTTSHHVYLHDMESFYGTLNITLQYDRSFRGDDITQALFGSSLYDISKPSDAADSCKHSGHSLVISGLQSADRNSTKDWMAENFLLPRNFKSVMSFSPLVQDFLADFNLYVGLDEWVNGLYFRLYGPVVNNRTTLNARENIITEGTAGYTQGYFSSQDQVTSAQLFKNALDFFSGNQLIAPIDNITFLPLQYAKFGGCGTESKTGFAELRGEFGWNYLHEDYHFGCNIQAAAPTGKRPHAEFLLEPEIGNGKHWELGAGISGHWTLWRSEDEERHFDFVIEADVTHLFNAKQKRTFDLIGKPHSRYMLAEKLVTNKGTTNRLTERANNNLEFGNTYSPVANFSTRNVVVSIGAQGDLVALFNYTSRGFSWDLGYNFWGMSRENIRFSDCDNPFPANTWALKGDASIAGQATVLGTPVTILLAATESLANIHTGTNILETENELANPGVDKRVLAVTGEIGATPVNVFGVAPALQIFTSNPAIMIKEDDLDITSAQISGMSNKIFTHLSYTWIDREDWVPYFGIGCNAELGRFSRDDDSNNSTATTATNRNQCDGGISFALSKWAVLVKGGVSFD